MKLIHIPEPEHTREGAFRKADAILTIKPQTILFEFPTEKGSSLSDFNTFWPEKKPKKWLDSIKKSHKKNSEKYPWLGTEHVVIEAVEKLWKEGRQVYLFEIDAPLELTMLVEVDPAFRGELNCAWNYLREVYMYDNIKEIQKQMEGDAVVLVICHDLHWKNIQFLRTDPSKEQIWYHYFSSATLNEVQDRVDSNELLPRHWNLKSHFAS